MNRWPAKILTALAALATLSPAPAMARPDETVWEDSDNDGALRHSVTGAPAVAFAGPLPDLRSITLGGWSPSAPITNPYAGVIAPRGGANIFRLQLVFDGLVSPPGSLGIRGLSFTPNQFGPRPLYGFFEFDVDDDIDTGGEPSSAAPLRLLGITGRFAARPEGMLGQRLAVSASSFDSNWLTPPQYERSGTDFTLMLCGCWPVTIVSQSGNNDSIFDAGETWVVRSRFFQRAGGYTPACSVLGGSTPGAYDPWTNLQWRHDLSCNRTYITLVAPITNQGYASLTGFPLQPNDAIIDVSGNAHSIHEALQDIVTNAGRPNLTGLTRELIYRWTGRNPTNYLDPTQWRVTGVVGVPYASVQAVPYAFTDVAFNLRNGDVNGDGSVSRPDRNDAAARILALDGTTLDADGDPFNRSVMLFSPGTNFDLYDADGDGLISIKDLEFIVGPCPADWNNDETLSPNDIFAFLSSYFTGDGDYNNDFSTAPGDIFEFLGDYFAGCGPSALVNKPAGVDEVRER
jgi:hypothetical protein